MEIRIKPSEEGFKEMAEIVRLNHLSHNPHMIWGFLTENLPDMPEAELKALKQQLLNIWDEYTR